MIFLSERSRTREYHAEENDYPDEREDEEAANGLIAREAHLELALGFWLWAFGYLAFAVWSLYSLKDHSSKLKGLSPKPLSIHLRNLNPCVVGL